MKKLCAYLKKIHADYHIVEYGYNYFKNVIPFKCSAAIVSFEFCDYETVHKWHVLEKKITRYASRYGYTIFNRGGCLGCVWFSIMKTTDRDFLEDYSIFERESVSECEKIIHNSAVSGGVSADVEKKLSAIMEYYGSLYNDFLKAVRTA